MNADLIKRAEALLLPGFDHRPVVATLLAEVERLGAELDEARAACKDLAAVIKDRLVETRALTAERDKAGFRLRRLMTELEQLRGQRGRPNPVLRQRRLPPDSVPDMPPASGRGGGRP